MSESSEHIVNDANLSKLLVAHLEEEPGWGRQDCGAIFRHEVSSPVVFEMTLLSKPAAQRMQISAAERGLVMRSLSDLLLHPSPPIELILILKEYAKANRAQDGLGLPDAVASALYFLAVASAWVGLRRRITSMQPGQLLEGMRWACAQEWIDPPLGRLLDRAIETWSQDL